MAVDTVRRQGKPRVWVTWVAKILGGDSQCKWSAWHKARHVKYKKLPDSGGGNLALWREVHDRLVDARAIELAKPETRILREREAEFELEGRTAILAGKCDLVAVSADGRVLIVDGKGGQPKPADRWQVLQYIYALPICRKDIVAPAEGRRAMMFSEQVRGEILYKDDPRVHISGSELTTAAHGEITHLLRIMGDDTPPARTPSRSECRFCDIADCPDRWQQAGPDKPADTTDF